MIVEKYTYGHGIHDRSSHPGQVWRSSVFPSVFSFADRLQRAAGLEIHRRWVVQSIGLLMQFMKSNFLGQNRKLPRSPSLFGTPKGQLWLCRKNWLGVVFKKNYRFLKVFFVIERPGWSLQRPLNNAWWCHLEETRFFTEGNVLCIMYPEVGIDIHVFYPRIGLDLWS